VRAIDVMPEAERRQVLEEWNATETKYPSEQCIHELIETMAANNPDALAVVEEDRQLSFGELNAQANRLAHCLLSQGLKPAERVAILLERSIEMVCSQLAILKCGAIFVTLDRNAPDERQAFIIADCEASLVLTAKSTRKRRGKAPQHR
jgi:non-ribosomal peptide synthetase component F